MIISSATLDQVADNVNKPNYDRRQLQPSIVHIGFGAFARAHQAYVLDALHREGKCAPFWGYAALSLRERVDAAAFAAQDFLYSVCCQDQQEQKITICASLLEVLSRSQHGIAALIARIGDAKTRIISLTITEKGYYYQADNSIDFNHPDIASDLINPKNPCSAIGLLYAGLLQRKKKCGYGVSVLSCDNFPCNGDRTRKLLLEYANNINVKFAEWIADNVTFPNTMVDRIVPAISDYSSRLIADNLNVVDKFGVICEPFLQWVIEDDFVADRPDWDNFAGVKFVANVVPYEAMKIRMLSGTLSFLAYLGYLDGYAHIADTMTNSAYKKAAYNLMNYEQAPTLNLSQEVDLKEYSEKLLHRFANPTLKHRTWQVASDGSQKIAQRFLESVRYHLEKGSEFPYIALAIAAWMQYVRGFDQQGTTIDVCDPHADALKEIATNSGNASDYVLNVINYTPIFPSDISNNQKFIAAITAAYDNLNRLGAREAIVQLVTNETSSNNDQN